MDRCSERTETNASANDMFRNACMIGEGVRLAFTIPMMDIVIFVKV